MEDRVKKRGNKARKAQHPSERLSCLPWANPKDLLLVITVPVPKTDYLADKQASLLDPQGNWTSYDTTPSTGINPNSAEYWQVEYTRSHPNTQCLREGILRIYESRNEDDQPITVHVELVACQNRFRELISTRKQILDSFTTTRFPLPIPTAQRSSDTAGSLPHQTNQSTI